jgi:AraC-like DNA-binding protein
MREAAQLLHKNRIKKVVYYLGFRDASHFSRLFRSVYGIASREWQRSQLRPDRGPVKAAEGPKTGGFSHSDFWVVGQASEGTAG